VDLKQSVAAVLTFGPFVDKTDGVTPEVGLVSALDHGTTGIMLSKNGGTLAVRHAAVTASEYDAHGCYKVTLDGTDTGTLGRLKVIYTDAATCLPVWQEFNIISAAVWDNKYGSTVLPVDVTYVHGSALTEAGGAGRLAASISTFGDVATPVFTAACVNQTIDNPTAAAIGTDAASKVLVTPAQKLVTDASGNVTLANGAHGGAAATLALLSATINNSAGVGLSVTGSTNGLSCTGGTGPGLVLASTSDAGLKSTGGTNHPAAELLGTGTGAGLEATGGLTGNGIKATGGATGGQGISAAGTGNNIGLYAVGNGVAPGMSANGGAEGNGFAAVGGSTSGHGISASATDGHGMRLAGGTAGEGLNATGGVTGHGIQATGGATSGAGIYAAATANNDAGMQLVKHGTGKDLDADQVDNAASDASAAHVAIDALVTTVGAAGAGLTALGDTRLANLDAAISTRTKPADTQAAVTTVATCTNLTNAPTAGDLTATMKASVTAAVPTAAAVAALVLATPAQKLVTDASGRVTVGSNADKTGYSMATAPPTAAEVKTALEADGSKLDHLWEMTEDDGGTRRLTTNALEQAPSGTGGDATAANQTTIIAHLTDVKGTGFVKDTNSLVNVTGAAPTNITVEATVVQD
jgi:hypothetical protein